ncbi:hypothetical protein Ddye_021036 [Dipteronia dyeriana]|uniref:Reverse transcriptase domain-containing protein n=1 Tax=Dipteronia dyeriana TaxID=168575 RepID=A0AAD9WWJ2_9ROSI|nr:hypothetical protein Ddye_021036 [Dipteronia dyeriana]
MPWYIGGDFNSVLSEAKKRGEFNRVSIRNFNSFVLRMWVADIPTLGTYYTWSNNRINGLWACLDRFLVSPWILSWFPKLSQRGFPITLSSKLLRSTSREPGVVKKGVRSFFEGHFQNAPWKRPIITGQNLKSLLEVDKANLEHPFLEEEVWKAVRGCDGNKASGPDGLNLNFIKANWDLIKKDFMNFMHGFHEDRSLVRELNKTFITLILKCEKPRSIKDFRPISLVGSMYKVLAKVLANHIKNVMDSVIGETQVAFVKNRQILG